MEAFGNKLSKKILPFHFFVENIYPGHQEDKNGGCPNLKSLGKGLKRWHLVHSGAIDK